MGSCLWAQNLPSSRPSDGFSDTSRAAGTLHLLVHMAAPRTVWRLRLRDGSVVHCVLWERRPKTAVVWYRDDAEERVEEFEDPAEAEDRVGELLTGFGQPNH